jgi:NAD(P) transhydrogenase subunit alpha
MEDSLKFFFDNREAIFIIILSIFLGIEVISHVPSVLHTPLMSGANAIHGVVIIGAIIVMGHADNLLAMILGFIAVVLGTLNVVGGFVVTDRMLEMFRKKKSKK